MHIHSAQASALGNALAGAQAAETAMSLRRARELRDAATRLKAASLEIGTSIPQDSETDAQTVSMISAWSGAHSGKPGPAVPEVSAADTPPQHSSAQIQEVQRTPPSRPVSYWV